MKGVWVNNLSKATLWLALGSGVSQGLLLIMFLWAAQKLEPEMVGRLGFLYQTYWTFSMLFASSFGSTTTRVIAEKKVKEPHLLLNYTFMHLLIGACVSGAVALIIGFNAPFLSIWWFQSDKHQYDIIWLAVALFGNGILTILFSALSGLKQYSLLSLMNISRGVFTVIFMTWGLLFENITEAMKGLSLATFVTILLILSIISAFSNLRDFSLRRFWIRSHYSELLTLIVPLLISSVIGTGSLWTGLNIIMRQPDGVAQMALLTVALQWRSLLLFLPTTINQAALPFLIELWTRGDMKAFSLRLRTSCRWAGLLTILPIPIIIAIQGWIAPNLSSWYALSVILTVLIATIFSALSAQVGNALIGMGRAWIGLQKNAFWALIFLGILALPISGALRFGVALLISYAILWWSIRTYVQNQICRRSINQHNCVTKTMEESYEPTMGSS